MPSASRPAGPWLTYATGTDTVLICGLTTSGCVRASAVDALQYGFAPFVVADACGDRDPRPHQANLFDLQAKYAEVITLDHAVGRLRPQRLSRERVRHRLDHDARARHEQQDRRPDVLSRHADPFAQAGGRR